MTQHLHDVLNDIASDVPQTDLVAGVAVRASRLRWMRRAVLGGTALGVAAVVGLITVGLPSWQQTTRPDREIPFTRATVPTLVPSIDLDAAVAGSPAVTSGIAVVRTPEGELQTVVLDVEHGSAVAIDAAAPADLEAVQLSSDGSRALLLGVSSAVVIEVATGATLYEMSREPHQPLTLSWDGRQLILFARDLTPDPSGADAGTPWQLTTVDLETSEISQLSAPLQRSSAAGEMFAAPDGTTVFVRYDGSVLDYRLHRLDIATGTTIYTEEYNALKTESMHWPEDGSLIEAETTSSVRILEPSSKIGELSSSVRKLGVPLGFAGPDHLVWWRPGTGEASLVLSDLAGKELPDTTTLTTGGTVVALATALG